MEEVPAPYLVVTATKIASTTVASPPAKNSRFTATSELKLQHSMDNQTYSIESLLIVALSSFFASCSIASCFVGSSIITYC